MSVVTSPLSLSEYLCRNAPAGSFGKTSPVYSVVAEETTSPLSLADLPDEILLGSGSVSPELLREHSTQSLGAFLIHSISECHRDAVESLLSDILELTGDHLQQYYLSAKACAGILRRAEQRGKRLPEILEAVLRRLTPLECERLQGFPDNYTNVPGMSDSSRYACIGNSMTVNVMRWIGRRIDTVDKLLTLKTLPEVAGV